MTVERTENWRSSLAEYIESVRSTPFQYGTHDCAMFAADAVLAMTGFDYAAAYRERYSDTVSGINVLRRSGFAGPVEYAASIFPPIPTCLAQVGDLAIVNTDEGPAFGVVQGHRVFLRTATGLTSVDLLEARAAFRV